MAALWRTPIVFSVENNRYAQTTPFEIQHAGDISERGKTFGINIHKADGMNVLDVAEKASAAVSSARLKQGPQLLYMDTYRFSPHSKGDDFRNPEEIKHFKSFDPINSASKMLKNDDIIKKLKAQIKQRIDTIIEELLESIL